VHPSKALLESSEFYHAVKTKAGEHGIGIAGSTVDLGG